MLPPGLASVIGKLNEAYLDGFRSGAVLVDILPRVHVRHWATSFHLLALKAPLCSPDRAEFFGKRDACLAAFGLDVTTAEF